ncbi:MAG: hypothetical protein ACYTAN_17320 [Planctomycetota bacterium]|jgi:hypothetical protein
MECLIFLGSVFVLLVFVSRYSQKWSPTIYAAKRHFDEIGINSSIQRNILRFNTPAYQMVAEHALGTITMYESYAVCIELAVPRETGRRHERAAALSNREFDSYNVFSLNSILYYLFRVRPQGWHHVDVPELLRTCAAGSYYTKARKGRDNVIETMPEKTCKAICNLGKYLDELGADWAIQLRDSQIILSLLRRADSKGRDNYYTRLLDGELPNLIEHFLRVGTMMWCSGQWQEPETCRVNQSRR